MMELFKIVKKKKLIILFFLKLITYLSALGVSFSYSYYITSPLTSDKLQHLIVALIILYAISLIANYFCTKLHELFIIDLKYDIELYYFEKLDKSELFRYVSSKGAFPRKTFSMGHADDKRFYIEGRRIK